MEEGLEEGGEEISPRRGREMRVRICERERLGFERRYESFVRAHC